MGRVLWLNSESAEVLNALGQVAQRNAAQWRRGVPTPEVSAADKAWADNWAWYDEHKHEWEGER